MSCSSLSRDVSKIVSLLGLKQRAARRCILGIAGPPGSGKSTLAEAVVDKLNMGLAEQSIAALLPMDGYHLDNDILEQKGLLHRKGAIETFNATEFCHAVKLLSRTGNDMFFPKFDRELDIAIANATWIKADARIIVVEGNYLLMPRQPWSALSEIFDASVFIAPPMTLLEERLMQRWIDHGLDKKQAMKRAEYNDLPNARLILKQSKQADLVLRPSRDVCPAGLIAVRK